MDRRRFLKKSAAMASVIMGPGLMLSCGRGNLRSDLMDIDKLSGKTEKLDQNFYKILYYASLAPSSHNSQPWSVKIIRANEWIVGSDSKRWLPEVRLKNSHTFTTSIILKGTS